MQGNRLWLPCIVSDVLFQILVRWQRQKFDELIADDNKIQVFRRLSEMGASEIAHHQ